MREDIAAYFESDEAFNQLYPEHIRLVSARHWTPVEVAEKVAAFLSTHDGANVLDIGSGAGKFCFIAAYHYRDVHFTGVEQRGDLVLLCNQLKEKLGLPNLTFIHGNMKDLPIEEYDHFYFYNSFYENLPGTQKIDYKVTYSEKLYDQYNRTLYKKLDKTVAGTRLATYHSLGSEVPEGFEVVYTDYAEFLKYWVKL